MKKFALAIVTANEDSTKTISVLKNPRRNVFVELGSGKKFKMFSTQETAQRWVEMIQEDTNAPEEMKNLKVWELKESAQYEVPKMQRKARTPKEEATVEVMTQEPFGQVDNFLAPEVQEAMNA